jgi:hypothetical protein
MELTTLLMQAYQAGIDHGIHLCEEEVRALSLFAIDGRDRDLLTDLVGGRQRGVRSLHNLRLALANGGLESGLSDRMRELMRDVSTPQPHPPQRSGPARTDEPQGGSGKAAPPAAAAG